MATQAQTHAISEFVKCGFTIHEPDDHIVELHHEGKLVARFSQLGGTEESIQAECARHLAMKHGWDGALWKK